MKLSLKRPRSGKSLLLVTTANDLSLKQFLSAGKKTRTDVTTILYDDPINEFVEKLTRSFDLVYFRDPFNSGPYDQAEISRRVSMVVASQPKATFIDKVKSIEGILFEDKFEQYKSLGKYMPRTEVLKSASQFKAGKHIIKKRISARSKDIAFGLDESYLNGEYIIQPLLEIETEYRVYCLFGKVIQPGAVKSSKKPGSSVKVQSTLELPENISEFAGEIASKLPDFDLIGLDIVRLKDGNLKLLEANRSCQFKAYARVSGINLAEKLLSGI